MESFPHRRQDRDFRPRAGDALVVVDVQRDFMPGGRLAVRHGDAVIAPLNACLARFSERRLPVYATRDWHPVGHCSFHAYGGPWPEHCVAGTTGAEPPASLRLPAHTVVVLKATATWREAYSAFEGTDLAQQLREACVVRLFVGGLATDYCVLKTVTDALSSGFEVVVVRDAVVAVEARPGDGVDAIEQMRTKGASIVSSKSILSSGL